MPKFDSSTAVTAATSQQALLTVEKSKSGDNFISCSPKVSPATVPISTSSQQLIHPFVPGGDPFLAKKYKSDNRQAAFRVFRPLPSGFADEHFSQYGDLSFVELDGEGHDQGDGSETPRSCSALVSFTSRQSAERAFVNGKSWQDHNLQLAWLASRNFDIILYPHNFLKEFILCQSILSVHSGQGLAYNLPDEVNSITISGPDSGVYPSTRSLVSIIYSARLLAESEPAKELLESYEDFELEMGNGAVFPHLEATVAQMSVG